MSYKFMPRPQKKRGNNGSDRQFIVKDSKQSKDTLSRGRVIGQKFLKQTIYNKKMNYDEITMNLYTYKLNEIPGIIDEIVRCVVTDAPYLKRICFETGYGKPKKAIDIRKCASHFLTNTLGYKVDKGGAPKTFKFLSDHSNRIVIFPQDYAEYCMEQQEIEEKKQEVIDAKNAKKEAKERKKRKKYFKHNSRRKKNLKYPEPKKKRQPIQPIHDANNPNAIFTPGGDDGDNIHESGDEQDGEEENSSSNEHEETEEAFLRNFMNLQVMKQVSEENMSKRARKRKKKDVDIFNGVNDNSKKFDYVDPDAWRYKNKPELNYIKTAQIEKEKQKKNMNLRGNNQQDWDCEFCSFRNDKKNKICEICYNEGFQLRYEKFMNTVNDNNKINKSIPKQDTKHKNEPRNAENDGKPKWTCDICTFINTGDDDTCEMCGTTDETREKYLDDKYNNYGKGLFDDAKPKKDIKEEKKNDDDGLSYYLKDENKVQGKKKKKKVKIVKENQKVVLDKNELYKNGKNSVNGQIANINRDWQAQVWRAHNDKQKRIEMLKRNGGEPYVKNERKRQGNEKGNKSKKSNDIKKNNDNQVGFVPHDHMKVKYEQMMNKKNGSNNNKKNKNVQTNGHKQNALKQHRNNNSQQNNHKKTRRGGKKKNVKDKQAWNQNADKKQNKKENVNESCNGTIKFEWIDKLIDMGFEYEKVVDALSNTNSVGYNEALDYLMQNV